MWIKLTAAAVIALAAVPHTASAQSYPTQDVHFIVGYAAGSGPDLIARWVADKMRTQLNRTIIVENKVGAGGNIAAEYVARSKPDGYTVLVTGNALAASAHLLKKPPIDVSKAFEVVATLARQPMLLVVGSNSPYKSMADLAAGIKAKGEKASYGTAFPSARVVGALVRSAYNTPATDVQYRTSADWINDLSSGQIDYAIIDAASGSGLAKAGRFRILAVTTAVRSALMDYPTLKDSGVDVDVSGWWATFVAANTPKAIVDHLNAAFTAVVRSPDAKTFFNGITNEPWPNTPAVATATFLTEIRDWGDYMRIAKIEPQD